jgi:hypothetical protein
MIRRLLRIAPFLILILLLIFFACATRDGAAVSNPSAQVLFIGNSYTYLNGGLDVMLSQIDPSISTERIAGAGYRLQDHWNDRHALDRIRTKKWTHVVLQEQSQLPVVSAAEYMEFAGKFSSEIRLKGAEVILLMTWERPDSISYGVTTENMANRINEAGRALKVKVAPAGLAFARSLEQKPDLTLYTTDGHPTIHGSYLAACVLYKVITGKSPVQSIYSPPGISDKDRNFLQQIASQTN